MKIKDFLRPKYLRGRTISKLPKRAARGARDASTKVSINYAVQLVLIVDVDSQIQTKSSWSISKLSVTFSDGIAGELHPRTVPVMKKPHEPIQAANSYQ